MNKLFDLLKDELKMTVKTPGRILLLIKKEKISVLYNRIRMKINDNKSNSTHKSAWLNWKSFDTMEKPWRVDHKSHGVMQDWLRKNMQGNSFKFLDCGVLSSVTYRKMKKNKLAVNYTGVDIAPQIIEDCKKRHPEVEWEVMDVQNLKMKSESFDVVYIRHVLEHLPYYDKAILEAKRVTKKYAVFCLFHPLINKDELKEKTKPEGKYHINKYGRKKFLESLNNNFSEIEEIFVEDAQRNNQLFFCSK